MGLRLGASWVAGYYRHIIEDFARLVAPMTSLTRNVGFVWTEDYERSFFELKALLTTAPVLVVPERGIGYGVCCDASGEGFRVFSNHKSLKYILLSET